MRGGLSASVFGHAIILAWGLLSFSSPAPLDASSIESIPVDFVAEDVTSAPKGVKTAAVAPKPEPEPVEKKVETPPPEPTPPPPPPPQPTAPPPEPTPPPPEPAPPPPPESAPPPPPEPPKAAQAEPPPPEPAPPQPTPEPPPPPPPPPQPSPQAPPPPPEPPPPAPQTATIQPKSDKVPLPKPSPRVQPPAPQVAKKEPDKFDPDQITALLDKNKQPPEPQPAANQPATQGAPTASIDAKMSTNELDALRAKLAQCWSPPIGWTDPAEVRVIVIISLNPDGTLSGEPKVVQQPQGKYAQTAAESALRAVRRCAPYSLPAEKYDAWKQVRVTFDPTEVGGA